MTRAQMAPDVLVAVLRREPRFLTERVSELVIAPIHVTDRRAEVDGRDPQRQHEETAEANTPGPDRRRDVTGPHWPGRHH